MTEPRIKNDFETQFLYAAKNGYIERAERLLLDGGFDPSVEDNSIIIWSAESGHDKVVRVLLKDKRIDPRAKDDFCIQVASFNGHVKVLEVLLEDGRSDPGAMNSIALWGAAQNGHYEIVEMLIKDGRVKIDSKSDGLTALEVALLNDHQKVASLLLEASRAKNRSSVNTSPCDDVEKTPVNSSSKTSATGEPNQKIQVMPKLNSASPLPVLSQIEENEKVFTTAITAQPPEKSPEILIEIGKAKDSLQQRRSDHSLVDFAKLRRLSKVIYSGKDKTDRLSHSAILNDQKPNISAILMDIVLKRKNIPISEFSTRLINLRALMDENSLPIASNAFNQALQCLLHPKSEGTKDPHRGTIFLYTKELLYFGNGLNGAVIDTKTLQMYNNHFGLVKRLVRLIFMRREKHSPLGMLENFPKA